MAKHIVFRVLNNPKSLVFIVIGAFAGWLITKSIYGVIIGGIAGAYLSFNV